MVHAGHGSNPAWSCRHIVARDRGWSLCQHCQSFQGNPCPLAIISIKIISKNIYNKCPVIINNIWLKVDPWMRLLGIT